MKPIAFTAPNTLDEAVSTAVRGGGEVGLLNGGTDLIIQFRSGRKSLTHMVDLKQIPELNVLHYHEQEGLRLGAAVSCARLTDFEPALRHYPALVEGAELIGSTQIQSRASVGGNVCNGSPAADTICPLIVHGAICEIRGPEGAREVAAEHFMTAPGRTVLKPGEILVAFRLPPVPKDTSSAYLRFIPRNEMDIAVADAAVRLSLGADGTVRDAVVAIGAVGPTPLMVPRAAAALIGSRLEESALASSARASTERAQPINDMRGTVEYRQHISGVLTLRAVRIAAERIRNPNFTWEPWHMHLQGQPNTHA